MLRGVILSDRDRVKREIEGYAASRERGGERERERDRHTDGERHRQRERDRQTDRKKERERERERQTERESAVKCYIFTSLHSHSNRALIENEADNSGRDGSDVLTSGYHGGRGVLVLLTRNTLRCECDASALTETWR